MRYLLFLLPLLLFLPGCAEHYTQYTEAIQERDIAVAQANAEAQTAQYTAWSEAIVQAGESNNTAALVALAMSRPQPMSIPTQQIKEPDSGADYLKAAVPLAGVVGGVMVAGDLIEALANTSSVVNNVASGGDAKVSNDTYTQQDIAGDAEISTCKDCDTGSSSESEDSEWYLGIEGCSSQESYLACSCTSKPDSCQ